MQAFKKIIAPVSIVLFLFTSMAHAAEDESWSKSIWLDLISPVTTDAYIPLAAGSAATLFLYLDKHDIGDPLQDNWSVHKPLGPASAYGDALGQWIPNLAYAAGMAIDGWGFDDKKSKARAILMLKASIYSGAVDLGLKSIVREPRPNGSNDMASFPSGHATTAFTFAAIIGAEHEWYWSVPAYAMATFVAASRINDNMHRLHDVVGGATLGISYGLGLYYRSHPNDAPAKPASTVFQVLPTDRMDGMIGSVFHEF